MEGRDPPSASSEADAEKNDNPLSPRRHETYVIQIPKDQIYRVPPPENALIAEHFRKPDTTKETKQKSRWPRCGFVLCMGIAMVVLSVVFVVALSSFYFLLNPQNPSFSITRFVVAREKGNPRSPYRLAFEISLKAYNENPMTGVYYDKSGLVALFSGNDNVIGQGQFPTLHQVEKSSADIRLVVHGIGNGLNSNDTKSDPDASLALQMKVPVTMNLGYLKIWRNEISIDCKFKVSIEASSKKRGSSILSQKCETQFTP